MSPADSNSLSPGSAEAILRHIHPTASVTEVLTRTGGQLSTVVEVRCAPPVEPVIIKFYAEEWRWKQEKEIHVYRLLEAHGIRCVPVVLHSEAAAHTVMTRLEGQPLSEISQDLDAPAIARIYEQLGALLARVHRIGQQSYGYLTTGILDPESSNADYMRRQFGRKLSEFSELGGDAALREAVEARIRDGSALFDRCRRPVLCHNDFHEGNVLVREGPGGWEVTGFVDVENAIAADPLVDLAKTEYYSIRGDQHKAASLRRGYGALPPDWAERIALYRLYHALELWDWFASIGQTVHLPGIADDIRRMTDPG
jgi:aminoglycoside phosphotransferase (APT) family kinase protein